MKNKGLLLLLLILFLLVKQNISQCTYQVRVSSPGILPDSIIKICTGKPAIFNINRLNCPSFLLKDDFNNSYADTNIWQHNSHLIFNNPCPPIFTPSSGKVAWMGNVASPRIFSTKAIDFRNFTFVQWDMKYGTYLVNGICNAPSLSNEGIHLQYSINGGTNWIDFSGTEQKPFSTFGSINYIPGSGSYWTPDSINYNINPYYKWNHYKVNIPEIAKTQHTQIRFLQTNTTNDSTDHWGIDNFELASYPKVSYKWKDQNNNLITSDTVFPVVDTWYFVTIIDSTYYQASIYYDSVLVIIDYSKPTSSFSIPTKACSLDTVNIAYTGNASLLANFLWDFGQDAQIISGAGAGPYQVKWYNPETYVYNVNLVINPGSSCSSLNTSQYIIIYPTPNTSVSIKPLSTNECAPFAVEFKNYSDLSNITKFLWDFGNGDTSTLKELTYTYLSSGIYNVSFYAETDKGCSDMYTFNKITVYGSPTPDLTFFNNTIYSNYFTGDNFEWFKGDEIIQLGTSNSLTPIEFDFYSALRITERGCISDTSIKLLLPIKSFFLTSDNLTNNPTNTYFGIKNYFIVKKIEIVDNNGQILRQYPAINNDNMYWVDKLSKGIYIVKIYYLDDVISINKLVKY